jgi:hypothetical protein
MRDHLAPWIAIGLLLANSLSSELAAAEKKRVNAIKVIEATYGGNCPGVNEGNATRFVAKACDEKDLCNYRVYYKQLGGDPAAGCDKDFRVAYSCGRSAARSTCEVEAEAGRGGEDGAPNQFCLLHCPASGALRDLEAGRAGDSDEAEAAVGSIDEVGSVTPTPPANLPARGRPVYRYRVERLPDGRFQVFGPFFEPR